MSEIDDLASAIRKLHGVESKHVERVPVKEMFQGETVWQGIVEVFELSGQRKAAQCFAWRYQDDDGKTHYTAVLKTPPVNTPLDAVRAALVAQVRNERKET